MFVVQGDRALNIDNCDVIGVQGNAVKGFLPRNELTPTPIATFDTAEQAKEYLALILQAYARGEKVFYC